MKDGNAAVRLARTERNGTANEKSFILGKETSGLSDGRAPRCFLIPFNSIRGELDPSSREVGCEESFLSGSNLKSLGRPHDDLAFIKCRSRHWTSIQDTDIDMAGCSQIFRHPESNMQAIQEVPERSPGTSSVSLISGTRRTDAFPPPPTRQSTGSVAVVRGRRLRPRSTELSPFFSPCNALLRTVPHRPARSWPRRTREVET